MAKTAASRKTKLTDVQRHQIPSVLLLRSNNGHLNAETSRLLPQQRATIPLLSLASGPGQGRRRQALAVLHRRHAGVAADDEGPTTHRILSVCGVSPSRNDRPCAQLLQRAIWPPAGGKTSRIDSLLPSSRANTHSAVTVVLCYLYRP
ncbi:hypothetical protein PHYPSEUDO_012234 [Phytophthora pseudosyringae]|uniref:Uncharacterized protein n=1 Tax=Phytophthora pseudosyringae TaxID=221518 RepID=A0A8T1V7X6_9STRA|nr:hypothetical protein PHYPSEUDO_012234 [Phytophthora pseudosyringae]